MFGKVVQNYTQTCEEFPRVQQILWRKQLQVLNPIPNVLNHGQVSPVRSPVSAKIGGMKASSIAQARYNGDA